MLIFADFDKYLLRMVIISLKDMDEYQWIIYIFNMIFFW